MRQARLAGVTGRPKWRHAKPDQVAADLVDRAFARTGPNQMWVTTSPSISPRKASSTARSSWTPSAAGWSAVDRRLADRGADDQCAGHGHPDPHPTGRTIIHSDQGAVRLLGVHPARPELRLVPSMGSVGDCYDNSLMRRSSRGCRWNCSTVAAGGAGSSWPTRSLSTWRFSTTAPASQQPGHADPR
jgi:putative transposase